MFGRASVGEPMLVWPMGPTPWDEDPWNDPRIAELTDDAGRRYDEFWDWVESRTPHGQLWLLDSIGVDPAVQGRGIGTPPTAAGLARARADRVGAFLSTGTARNVSSYGRSGFRVVEDLDAPGGGPHIWFKRWDPCARQRSGGGTSRSFTTSSSTCSIE
jgi:GNAT superfamily N-acetyltransferase